MDDKMQTYGPDQSQEQLILIKFGENIPYWIFQSFFEKESFVF